MGRVAEAQLAQRPMHIAWNRAARADLLILLEDGSVHLLDVERCLQQRISSAGEAPSLAAQVLQSPMTSCEAVAPCFRMLQGVPLSQTVDQITLHACV